MNTTIAGFGGRFTAMALTVVLSLIAVGARPAKSADAPDENIAFSVTADLNGDGFAEIIVGVDAWSEPHIAEFSVPGDVYVYEHDSPLAEVSILHQVFQCRSAIPAICLSAFFQPSLISIADLDGDSLPEAVIVWYEQCWWPTAYRPLSVLQFNPEDGVYELIIDPARFVGEIGGYAVEDVDHDGTVEILEIDPIYGTQFNVENGTEEWECHYCPHQYAIQVVQFDGLSYAVDPDVNSGEVYITPDKYLPEVAWEAITSFLPEILTQIRAMAATSSTASDD